MVQLSQLPRVALVIGVQEYIEVGYQNLHAVHDDVGAMVKMLEAKGGFAKVTACLNPTKRTLIRALSKFKGDIKQHDKDGGCVALLYYSGHGMMDKSNHFLLPTDWQKRGDIGASLAEFACMLEGETGVLAHLTGAKAAVALFDCCRSFADRDQAKGGTAESNGGWEGSIGTPVASEHSLLLCYACSPGGGAYEGHEHGHFTEAILKHLCAGQSVSDAVDMINEEVMRITKQQPYVQYCILRPFEELCLGLPEISSAADVEATHSSESARSPCESRHVTATGARSDGSGHQPHGLSMDEKAALMQALLDMECWGRQGTSIIMVAALGIVAVLLAYFYVVVGMGVTMLMTGVTVCAWLYERKLSKGVCSVAMAATGVAAGCLASKWPLIGVTVGIFWAVVHPAVRIFLFERPMSTNYFAMLFVCTAAATVPAGCILEFQGSAGLALGFIIALGEAWGVQQCYRNM